MTQLTNNLVRATRAHQQLLLSLIASFCEVDGHAFDKERIQSALTPLLSHDTFGRVYLITASLPNAQCREQCSQEQTEDSTEASTVGYLIITWGYSLESGGREALIDEIYVRERGAGHGTNAMNALLNTLTQEGFKVIFLETERPNSHARRFYQGFGFQEDDSIWMSKPLRGSANETPRGG